ncbi:MAG: GHMP kinase [Candidatus Aminicenantes bacterium]|nr:GHMP kinase [Candidatus Aminicenantes bacterium]
MRPARLIHARAPLRINDLGGWTDTWFAGRGRVLNLAVHPAVEVEIRVFPNPRCLRSRVDIRAENYGERFAFDPDSPGREPHGLLQFAVAALPPGPRERLEISIYSAVPAGISIGTSASVCVALIGALDELRGGKAGRRKIARLAHLVETEGLGLQSGLQDQIAAAWGGISMIEMPAYPKARVVSVRLPPGVWSELERRLVLVYLGAPHRSSAMHVEVIAALESGGPGMKHIRAMAEIPPAARRSLSAGDFTAYGQAMIRNNECQRGLHPGLISRDADAIASVARAHGAAGWKVNGAGGEGGSMTILAPASDSRRREMVRAIEGLGRGIRVIPVVLSRTGVEAWTVPSGAKDFSKRLSNPAKRSKEMNDE